MRRVVSARSVSAPAGNTAVNRAQQRPPLRSLLVVVIVVVVHLAVFEVVACLSAQLLRERHLLYSPPDEASYVTYLQGRDPVLGWPSKEMLNEMYDEAGSRHNPYYPLPHKPCVSVYGDSATYAEDVSDSETWSAQLSRQLGCRVANYGVPGYGTDQSFLRFSLNQRDEAPVVVLSHFSADIRRNVNQLRNLLTSNSRVMLKPRFVLEGNQLRLIPLPQLSAARIAELFTAPAAVVEYEYFLPGSGRGVIEAKFPYLFSVGSLFLSQQLGEMLDRYPAWMSFYQRDHPSNALDVTVGIIKRFISEATIREKEPIVAIIPDTVDLKLFVQYGKFSYAPMVAQLEEERVAVLDVGAALIALLKGRNACELAAADYCSGGFNAEGQRLLAQVFLSMFAMTQNSAHGVQPDVDMLGAAGQSLQWPVMRMVAGEIVTDKLKPSVAYGTLDGAIRSDE
jgi:hypothetical protein